jgi:hypothetical protein
MQEDESCYFVGSVHWIDWGLKLIAYRGGGVAGITAAVS